MDYDNLKSHPFFKGVNWGNLATTSPPFDFSEITKVLSPRVQPGTGWDSPNSSLTTAPSFAEDEEDLIRPTVQMEQYKVVKEGIFKEQWFFIIKKALSEKNADGCFLKKENLCSLHNPDCLIMMYQLQHQNIR